MRKSIAVISIVAAFAAGGLFFRFRPMTAAADVHPSSAATKPSGIRAEGRVTTHPNASVTVGTERGGTLTAFAILEKASVKRGETIAELDSAQERAALTEARAHVRETDVSVGFFATQTEKSRRLFAAGAVARDDLDRNQHQLDAAIASRTAFATTVARLTTIADKSKIKAPIDGVVLERFAEEGETLAPGARLLTIADLSRLRIEAEVDEFDAPRVRLGAAVTIDAEGLDGGLKGQVDEIPVAITRRRIRPEDPTRSTDTRVLLVKIAVTDASKLRLGQRVEVAIER